MNEITGTRPAVERMQPPDLLFDVLVNPVMRRILTSRFHTRVSDRVLLLRYRGRRSGQTYSTPAGYRRIDGRLALLTNGSWRHNFRGGHDAEVVLQGEPRAVRGELLEDPEEVVRLYEDLIDEVGLERAGRELGIRINVDRRPTHEELVDCIRRSGLSVVWLDPA